MSDTRFRHCAGFWPIDPRVMSVGADAHEAGESLPWSGQFAKRVFDGEWADSRKGERAVAAAIDDVDGSVVGFVQFVHSTRFAEVVWLPEPPVGGRELSLGLYTIDPESSKHPQAARTHAGYGDGEVEANEGRLRLTHVSYQLINDDGSAEMTNWINGGDCSARKVSTLWDASGAVVSEEIVDFEDAYDLVPEDLWFDYPEFDRYDDLIFRDAPALEKLGVPAEIRLKPVPPMPGEVSG